MKKIIIVIALIIELNSLIVVYISSLTPKTKEDTNLALISSKTIKDDYIIGVVACEMPASYNIEALKAQAVAARTFLEYELTINNNISYTNLGQCYSNLKTLKEKWNDKYDEYYNKIRTAVIETQNEIMLKDNKLFKSFYFSTSNGYTESSQDIFKEGNILPVSSEWDKTTNNYEVITNFTKQQLINKLGNFTNIKIIKRNNTNHVLSIKVDEKEYTGVEFRKLLGLRSTDFDIAIKNDTYSIITRGFGHGVGMSQTGAGYLANQGYDYKYILNYYYQDIKLSKI